MDVAPRLTSLSRRQPCHPEFGRRLNLRYKDDRNQSVFCHSLNNTVIASPRILIPILELYQNADGTVTVPEVLRAYMRGKEVISD